ncbi:hypothetical protein AAG906_006951 [Vitis piasezkii]
MSKEENYSNHSDSFTSSFLMTMPVMATGTTSVEEQLVEMARAIAKLTKMVEEKDMQIASLINKVEAQVQNTGESSHGLNHPLNVASPLDDAPHTYRTMQGERQMMEFVSMASLSVQQLQDMITNTIRAQYGGPSQSTLMYSKPYTKRIDNLRMPMGYQPPKFQSFDGKGNPKQHVAHFVETCNNAGTDGDLLVKQFVHLTLECIDSWDQMEREFLNRFYSTRQTVSMMELTNTKQWKDESIVNYINHATLTQENERFQFTLKELEEKRYPFPNSNVPSMLEDLLQKKIIELPECKRPKEMGCVNDPNYCHYHRIVSHLVEKCFILKNLIMKLAKQGRIHLDLNEVVESNHATVTFGSLDLVSLHVPLKKLEACANTIQCESLKPKQTQVSC